MAHLIENAVEGVPAEDKLPVIILAVASTYKEKKELYREHFIRCSLPPRDLFWQWFPYHRDAALWMLLEVGASTGYCPDIGVLLSFFFFGTQDRLK